MPTNGEIINPNEDIQIPHWLTADFFKTILIKEEPELKKILQFRPMAAIAPGENFTSVMIRVHVDLLFRDNTEQHKSYILKTTLDLDKGGAIMEQLCLFPKELAMYSKYLPAFQSLYKAAGKEVNMAPNCLYTNKIEDQYVFIFEDLQKKSFANANRLEGLNMKQMRCALEKLAEFHAASAVYVQENEPFPEQFEFGFFHKNATYTMENKERFESRKNIYKKSLAEWNLPDYVKKFPNFEQYCKGSLRALQVDANAFNVLNHGDFWTSNMMFRYNGNSEIEDLLLLDFQLCKWGSPAEDLLFFITNSAAKDIRIKEFDYFVQIYHEYLMENLKLLGYKKRMPQLRELHMSMFKMDSGFLAFFALFNHLPVINLPTDKDSNAATLFRNDEIGEQFREKAFRNQRFVDAAKEWFTFYHRRGLFNFDDYKQ